MDYNYHTHTFYCHHARGTPEEYVLRAIEGGIKYMGFSDHAPFVFPDGYESYFRVSIAEVKDYFSELYALREKYKDKLNIKIGFEMEYYPKYFDQMLKTALEAGAEYLILGQHFLGNEHPDGKHVFANEHDSESLDEYVTCILSAIDSGVFTYIAHPDMLNFTEDMDLYNRQMRRICKASREKNIPLEINCQGMRRGNFYPNEKFWEIASQEKSPVTIGLDAHAPVLAYDPDRISIAKGIIEKYNLNYIGKPEIKLLREKKQ